jgi:hypothetical protein
MQHDKDENLKIKRFGQVFSGKLVGELLVSMLPDSLAIRTIIDPMVGRGDLLQAAHAKYLQADVVFGIDIDKDVIDICNNVIPEAKIINKDAFRSEEINIANGWDLVITNPPYIRYQTLKSNPKIGLPNGDELRNNLIAHIKYSKILNDKEKQLYLEIIKNYSGLSDMAVPSWILCSSIVKQDGYIAMVVPETWLNREYALPIHYLLLRCFEVIVLARDVESAWFENAQVRTCLVICRRKAIESIYNSYAKTVLIDINSEIVSQNSLVSKMVYNNRTGYAALNQIISSKTNCEGVGFSSRWLPTIELFPGLLVGLSEQKWICKEDKMKVNDSHYIPNEIKAIVSKCETVEYDTLESLGWSVGQGLRTGANSFFYADIITDDPMTIIQTQPWYGANIPLSIENYKKALMKRSDVNSYVIDYNNLVKCIIYIQHQVRHEDYIKLSHNMTEKYSLIADHLNDYITKGESYISPSHRRPFRELSAVITNEKKTDSGFERFWYMLPPLKERHIPNLCISRVCGESPETLFIKQETDKEIVVDANFITLCNADRCSQLITFAVLNSTWAKLFLEVTGTAMGGGALKIEASHVRKIVIPRIDNEKKKALESIGEGILENGYINKKIQKQIDEIITYPFGEENRVSVSRRMDELLKRKIQERTGRKYDK